MTSAKRLGRTSEGIASRAIGSAAPPWWETTKWARCVRDEAAEERKERAAGWRDAGGRREGCRLESKGGPGGRGEAGIGSMLTKGEGMRYAGEA